VALLRHFWIFLVAFVWAVAYLLRERVRPLVWAPLLLLAAALISGVGRRVAAFYLASFLLAAAGFVWSYWISPSPLDWHIATSAPRVVTVLILIGLAALVHLSGLLLNAFTRQRIACSARDG
jgi:hypothetical protein